MYKLLTFADSDDGKCCKVHITPVGLIADAVISDLYGRGHSLVSAENVVDTALDLPGMVLANRPWSEFQLPGLRIDIACENVDWFFGKMSRLKDRGGYYKIHSWNHCLVLEPKEFFILMGQIETELPSAEARDKEFFEAWKAKHGKKG